ncbi:hypothetical protein ABLN97_13440 [Mycobacterium tuberculosis]
MSSLPATPMSRSRHLVARAYRHGDGRDDFVGSVACRAAPAGHFTLVFANADDPGTLVAARRSTPLVLGIGDNEMFVGSDVAAFIEHTRKRSSSARTRRW